MTQKIIHYQGKYISLVQKGRWEYVERVGNTEAAIIFPVFADKQYPMGHPERNKMVVIKEYRIPFEKYVVGMPAGLVGDKGDEPPEIAAFRELLEETGYKAGRMRHLTSGPPSSGLSNEILHFYLADELEKVTDDVGVDGEDITVHLVSISKIHQWLKSLGNDMVVDPKLYMGLYFASTMDIR